MTTPRTPQRPVNAKITRVVERGRGDRGVILVLMALCLVVLMIFAGLMVDLGAWYQQSQDIQRTADAAALAGATYLPDSPGVGSGGTITCGANIGTATPIDAYCAAVKAVIHNGYPNAIVTAVVDPANNRQLDVTVTQGGITGYFTSFFVGPMTFNRSAHAQFSQPINLGSPQNYFGTGTLEGFTGFNGGGNSTNFWASISGYCEAKEAGDEFASGFDGNVGNVHNGSYVLGGSFPQNCNPSSDTGRIGTTSPTCNTAQNMNCEFDPLGYSYTITVPPNIAGGSAHVYIFNPAFSPCQSQPAYDASQKLLPTPSPPFSAPLMDIDSNLSAQYPCGGSVPGGATKMTTYYTLSGPDGSITTYKKAQSYGTGYPTWTELTKQNGFSPLTPGTYYLNVSTIQTTVNNGTLVSSPAGADAAPSFGIHNYGILVDASGTTPKANLTTGGNYVCPSASDPAPCPTIFANTATAEAATIVSSGGSSAATAYLANVPPAAVGKTVTLKIWDPGDYAQYLQIIKPDGTALGSLAGETISYAVFGANPDATPQYGGSLPSPNNTTSTSGTLAGCTDPLTGSTFAGSTGPCFPVDGCVPLDASNSGLTAPLTDCAADLTHINDPTPPTDWGAPNNRYGMSRYSDSMVELSFTAPVAGWYGIREVTNQAQVHDTITVNLLINGLPPHLTP